MPDVVISIAVVEHEVRVPLVDGVVGQVHHHIAAVALTWRLVFARRKTSQPVPVHINSQGIDAPQKDIYPEIKFQTVYQKGPLDVFLHYEVAVLPVSWQLQQGVE